MAPKGVKTALYMYLEHAEPDDFDRTIVDLVQHGGIASQFLSELVEVWISCDQFIDVGLDLGRDEVVVAASDRCRVLERLLHLASDQLHYLPCDVNRRQFVSLQAVH